MNDEFLIYDCISIRSLLLMKKCVMSSEVFVRRTKKFAVDCVKLTESLPDTRIGNHIGGQLMRCSSSTAANYRASRLAQSKAAFIAKLSIVIEEADESEFWIDFAESLGLIDSKMARPLVKEAHEIASIFIAARKTMQLKNQKS